MSKSRKRYSSEFKAKVALEALKGLKTIPELAQAYGVHPTQITQWKQRLREGAAELFGRDRGKAVQAQEAEAAVLYEKIGRQNMELEWLKKKVSRVG